MARTARADRHVPLPPEQAAALWSDPDRWASFVEGFARLVERGQEWPSEGARVVWESIPGGRGRVTERVVAHGPEHLATQVFEERLAGTQTAHFAAEEGGSRATLELEYELEQSGPINAVADALFIRRALRDALARTLRRFAVEAEEQAGLR